MDSLLASYASSDEEEDHHHQQPKQPSTSSSLFSSLPKPQSFSSSSSSVFSSIPPPKSAPKIPRFSQNQQINQNPKPPSLFSSIPPPNSQNTPDFSPPTLNPKRVVQFHPPLPQNPPKFDPKDDDEIDEEDKKIKNNRQMGQDTSVKSFLSSMPIPKNSLGSSLGSLPPSSGSGRRSIVDTNEPAPVVNSVANVVVNEVGFEAKVGNGEESLGDGPVSCGYDVGVGGDGDQSYVGYEGYGGYHGSYGGYEGSYDTSLGAAIPETMVNVGGKRRKDHAPTEIIEVKQDELMKNRPREDKSKLTGMAFGPSYQPASSKGKPSKLHKRKHQIGSLYFDMRQKEMELAERRSKGLLTKAETQAKYGW